MPEYLIDNIFALFSWRVFQITVGILMGTNCDCSFSRAKQTLTGDFIEVISFVVKFRS
jgi:hypothetical protein